MSRGELREPTFLILASVAAQPQHGYGIKRAIDDVSDGRVELATGTVYSALDRLAADGLVADAGDEVVNGRNRRYYVLTDAGAVVLDAEVKRLRANASHAADQLRYRQARNRGGGLVGANVDSA